VSDGPFFDRINKVKKIGAAGRRAENSLASRLRGETTMASGALARDKGDVKITRKDWKFLMEAKSTQKDSISLKLDWLLQIAQQALEAGKTASCAINFTNDHGVLRKHGSWIMVREDVFRQLIDPDDLGD
jgi:Holliday junction resolvase